MSDGFSWGSLERRFRDRVLGIDEIKMLKDKLPDAHMERQTELAI